MEFHTNQDKILKKNTLIVIVCADRMLNLKENGFVLVETLHSTAVLWSCFSPVWQNQFFYLSR